MQFWLSWILFFSGLYAGTPDASPAAPGQPEAGPGGHVYQYSEVIMRDFAEKPDGYWLFEPNSTQPDTAAVVVFLHGYGAINPMIYGAWIRHLVRQGHLVIYPRYQRNLFLPRPGKFAKNANTAIHNALDKIRAEGKFHIDEKAFFFAGHSYGGTIAANLVCQHEKYRLPAPQGVMLCAPGTGPFSGGLLESYEEMPEATRLVIAVSINDYVVGEELGQKIFQDAIHTPGRNLIRIIPDDYGAPALTSEHNEAYALDKAFDSGLKNLSTQRALSIGKTNATDYYVFWKMLDGIMDCALEQQYCDYALGDTPEQRNMGYWSDGKRVQELEVWTP